jgi:SAM-dependent methyltransferase
MPPLPPLQWSQAIETLHRDQVILPIINDKRTDPPENVWLGYPFKVIHDEVIKMGLADFTVGHEHEQYGDLTPDEKVLLYCFVNMKLHFFETLSTFRAFKPTLRELLDSPRPPLMIDLGCGPGTAALALADCLGQPTLRYFGLDISRAMLKKANSMLTAAIDASLFARNSQVLTTSSWQTLRKAPEEFTKARNVFFNATYLFASKSLDVDDVCGVVTAFLESPRVHKLVFIDANSTAEIAREKYALFKKHMKGMFTRTDLEDVTIRYRKKRLGGDVVAAKFKRQLLRFKG